ncbi:MAG: NERD domain-containing protein, partial [Cytophagaceae bacterium]
MHHELKVCTAVCILMFIQVIHCKLFECQSGDEIRPFFHHSLTKSESHRETGVLPPRFASPPPACFQRMGRPSNLLLSGFAVESVIPILLTARALLPHGAMTRSPVLDPMASPDKHWKTMARSQFPWEQEALDFIHERFPAQDNYRAWANFEFIADDGSINEVDVLVACPQGIFLIEIKSNPGHLWGDAQDWTWHNEGRRKTVENPLILANRKCKRLKSLLSRQKAFRDGNLFIEPLVFVSHSEAKSHLTGNATFGVTFRDSENPAEKTTRPGIIGAIKRRECPGLRQHDAPPVNRPLIKAITQAMEQAGIKPSQKTRKVGDFILDDLVFDSPTGLYQDWLAHHVSHSSTRRCARI